jgi:hypothetical protein
MFDVVKIILVILLINNCTISIASHISHLKEDYGKEIAVCFIIVDGENKKISYPYVRCNSIKKKSSLGFNQQFNNYRKKQYKSDFRVVKKQLEEEKEIQFYKAFSRMIDKNDWKGVNRLFFEARQRSIWPTKIIMFLENQDEFIRYLLDIFYRHTNEFDKKLVQKVSNISKESQKLKKKQKEFFKSSCMICYEFAVLGFNKKFLYNTIHTSDQLLKKIWEEYALNNIRVKYVLTKDIENEDEKNFFSYLNKEIKILCPFEQVTFEYVLDVLYSK